MLRCELTPLSLKDTAAYISARVRTAGGEATRLFTRDAVVAIHQHSTGIPARHQRDLRQRAGQRFCRRSEAGWREHRRARCAAVAGAAVRRATRPGAGALRAPASACQAPRGAVAPRPPMFTNVGRSPLLFLLRTTDHDTTE